MFRLTSTSFIKKAINNGCVQHESRKHEKKKNV